MAYLVVTLNNMGLKRLDLDNGAAAGNRAQERNPHQPYPVQEQKADQSCPLSIPSNLQAYLIIRADRFLPPDPKPCCTHSRIRLADIQLIVFLPIYPSFSSLPHAPTPLKNRK